MGASLSNLTADASTNGGPGLGDIPESCVACVFLYLTPPEICNLARLNRAFRGAASSDAVWMSKLPNNYQHLLDLMPPERYQHLCKKDIYAILSRPVPFDGGYKEVWLDKISGRVCMSISARALSITGIEDRRYWNWIPTEESSPADAEEFFWRHYVDSKTISVLIQLNYVKSIKSSRRFQVMAYLQQIWWFEVDGLVKFPLPPDTYTLSFRIHLGRFSKRLGRRICNFEHTHGWDVKPVKFELSTSDGQQASSQCYLDESELDYASGNQKRGRWIDYKVGEFMVSDSDLATEVRFSMKQIDCTHSKGGLCLDTVYIIPSDLKSQRRRYGISK